MSSRGRILIVDDEANARTALAELLRDEGYVVEMAADGFKALPKLEEFSPDLLLTDLKMPGLDGIELTQRLKADPATRHIVILALTAYAMKGDEAKMRAAGCDGYIAKPIDVASFATQVRSFIGSADSP